MRVRCKNCQSVVERDRLEGLSYDPGSLMPDSFACPVCGAVDSFEVVREVTVYLIEDTEGKIPSFYLSCTPLSEGSPARVVCRWNVEVVAGAEALKDAIERTGRF